MTSVSGTDDVTLPKPSGKWAKVISKLTCADPWLFLRHQKYNSHLKMKIASPSDEVCIERSENRAFDRALIGGDSYFRLEVRTGCANLGFF